jgi:hypothetical protein
VALCLLLRKQLLGICEFGIEKGELASQVEDGFGTSIEIKDCSARKDSSLLIFVSFIRVKMVGQRARRTCSALTSALVDILGFSCCNCKSIVGLNGIAEFDYLFHTSLQLRRSP